MKTMGSTPVALRSGVEIAARSRAGLDRPLDYDAEFEVAIAEDSVRLVGAFQRIVTPPQRLTARRGSGGPELSLEKGTVHVGLALRHPGALVPCEPARIVNRLVRPLLRALTRCGHVARYFGRDWISVSGSPVGWVGFAHDAETRRTFFEALIAVTETFADAGPSFLGKIPGTLEAAAGKAVDSWRVAGAIVEAYSEGRSVESLAPKVEPLEPGWSLEPPWAAVACEAIGWIGAGNDGSGVFRVGGDLLITRVGLGRLEARTAAADFAAIGRTVDETLTAPGVAVEGIRSFATIRDVIIEARRAQAGS